ncbi:MAG: aconitase X, partial [Sulfobacillus thermotolerans]|nr:aconitase X [Sulfobacillus thermotolerans]
TPYVNSIYGARTNRESAQSALCAAITGLVPEYGLLRTHNRRAEVVVEVEARMDDGLAYQLLGYAVAPRIRNKIPVFTGLNTDISPEDLMNLGAELNTAGAVSMYHIVGLTPEAQTLDMALGRHEPQEVIHITQDDLDRVKQLNSKRSGPIDFVMLGCPHLSLRQLQTIAALLHGQTLKTELWLNTSASTRLIASRMGITQIIEQAGGHVLQDTCVDQPIWNHLAGKIGATDSLKCAYYTTRRSLGFSLGSIEACIEASLKGAIGE